MKTPNYTKGPWINLFNPRGPKGLSHEVWTANRQTLIASELKEANAHLIAAAPEMLECIATIYNLANIQTLLETKYSKALVNDIMKMMNHAIQKTKGEK